MTSKYQTTIPKKVREILELEVNDRILFEIKDGNEVIIRKASSLDTENLFFQNSFSEWSSEADEIAFQNL